MRRNRIIILIVVLAVFSGLLALDLANQGLAWRVFWNLTGEETPLAQMRGMVEWAGNFTRTQPVTKPMVPIDHTYENPYGINVFLEQEVEPEKRERILQMVSEAGFTWIRQQFPWEDIEIHGRSNFDDRRNDLDGDGTIDTISAWAKYDQIVDLADAYDVQIFARLDNPPDWSRENPDMGAQAPPDDVGDFVDYAVAVAERYKGKIHYYQVWNEPNIFPEWGHQAVSPEAYTDLLCRTHDALKAVDPEIVVVSGALAPTVSLTGRDLNDFIFLQRMYDVGVSDCFDILAVQGYGFNSGPTDRRMRPTTVNFAHNLYIRDLMVANGDENKAIWISEAAWNPIDSPDVPPDVSGRANYGIVTQEQAARYMPLGYQRAQQEWPWVGAIFYWFFKRPADVERDQSWYYFRMVEPDFTPLPVYEAMKDYITTQQPVLYPGVHQAENWATGLPEGAEIIEIDGAEFGQAVQTDAIWVQFYGTDVIIRVRGKGRFSLSSTTEDWDGGFIPTIEEFDEWDRGNQSLLLLLNHPSRETMRAIGDDWANISINTSLLPTLDSFYIRSFLADHFEIDSITVIDRTYENLFGPVAAVVIGVGMLLGVVWRALWERRKR